MVDLIIRNGILVTIDQNGMYMKMAQWLFEEIGL